MLAQEMKRGVLLARRDPPKDVDAPLTKVRVVSAPRARQVKVRYEEGDLAGLEEWVPSRTLVCPWGDRSAFLRDEQRAARLREASEAVWDKVVEDAISAVLTATGEEGGFIRSWATDLDKLKRLWSRAHLDGDPLNEPLAYKDRFGTAHLSFNSTLRFAQAFAAAEPEPCLMFVQEWEDKLRAEGFELGNRHSHQLLREWTPGHALVRDWASRSEVALLRKEIERLHRVVELASSELTRLGAEREANRVRRALKGQ